MFLFKGKIKKREKGWSARPQAGMTYIELIVVLSIFSIMTSVVLFDYDRFQAKVDIKNLANDIALQIVEAQKMASSGRLPTQLVGASWRPSYGVYFDLSTFGNNKNFVYFADLDQSGNYNEGDGSFCGSTLGTNECIDKLGITKNYFISDLQVFYQGGSFTSLIDSNLSITFTRPNSEAIIKSTTILSPSISYAQIDITSPSGNPAKIKIYASGRIQID